MNLSSQEEPNLLHPAHALPRFCTHSPTPNSTARSADKSCKQTTDPSTPGPLTPRQTLQPSNMHNQTMQLKMTLKKKQMQHATQGWQLPRVDVAVTRNACCRRYSAQRHLEQIQAAATGAYHANATPKTSCCRCCCRYTTRHQTSGIPPSQSEVVEAGGCYIATSQTQPVHPADLKQLQTAVKVPHATLVHTARWLKDAPAAVVV